jgi:hypothetical protein
MESINSEFSKSYLKTNSSNKFYNLGFNTYLKAGFDQVWESYKIMENEILLPDFNETKKMILSSFENREINEEDYILIFDHPNEHPAIKFVKDTFIKMFNNLKIDKLLLDNFINHFNFHIERKIIDTFGMDDYEIQLSNIKEKWLKENEITFLLRMRSLSKIGFAEGEQLKYQDTFGMWKDVNYLDKIDENENDKEIDKEELKLNKVEYLIDEYYARVDKKNRDNGINHYFNSILFIIADFGKGKSSFLKQYAGKLATEYLKTGEGYFPIYFNLAEYSKYNYSSKLGIIGKFMESEFAIKLDDEYYKKKKYLFLVDSLDECGDLTDTHINSVINDIQSVHNIERATRRNNRIIVTSRPIDQGLKRHLLEHCPFEIEDTNKNSIPQYISVYGFKKHQFNNYVIDALTQFWAINSNKVIERTGLSREIYDQIQNRRKYNIHEKLLGEGILKPSELKRPIFAYMVYSLISNNVDFLDVGKIGIYISFLNQLTKDAKHRDDPSYKVELKDEYRFRNMLHATSALWQYKRQSGHQGFLKKADICRTLVGGDEKKSDEEVLKANAEVVELQFLSHSYLGEKDNVMHFQHQSFAEMLLAEYYLKVFIKFALETNLNIEDARKSLILGVPTQQTIEFLVGLLELLKACSVESKERDILDKRKLLAPIMASLATNKYARQLFSERIYIKWFEDIERDIQDSNIKTLSDKYLEQWPIKEFEITKIVQICTDIINSKENYLLTRADNQTLLFDNEITKIQNKVISLPPDMDKWLALLVGNKLFTRIDKGLFFNKMILDFKVFFEMIKDWNYSNQTSCPNWAVDLFMGIDMLENNSFYTLEHLQLDKIDFSYSNFLMLNINFSNIHHNKFIGTSFQMVEFNYCHFYMTNYSNTIIYGGFTITDCIFVVRGVQGPEFLNINLNSHDFLLEDIQRNHWRTEKKIFLSKLIKTESIDDLINSLSGILNYFYAINPEETLQKINSNFLFQSKKDKVYFNKQIEWEFGKQQEFDNGKILFE